MKGRPKALFTICFTFLLALILVSGCGGGTTATSPDASSVNRPAAEGSEDVFVDGDEELTAAEKEAATEAVQYAQDSNTGSEFKTVEIVLAEDWARADVEEVGVPSEEAVGFSIYLRKLGEGEWEVVETGTDITSEDIPGAPGSIF